jgi:drug/metabolite transporter (DMT)-like permease
VTTAIAAPRQRTSTELGLIAGSIAVVMWGVGPLFVRAMAVSAPSVVVFRFALGVPVIVTACYLFGGRLSVGLLRIAWPSGVLFGGSIVIGFMAVIETSVANAGLIGNLMPVLVVLIARFVHHEPVRGRQFAAAALAVAGIAAVVVGADGSGEASLRGDAMAVVSLVLWTVYFLRTKRLRDADTDAWSLIAAITIVAAVTTIPICLVISDDLGAVGGVDWLYLVLMVVGPGVLGHGLMTWASKHLAVTVSALLTLASPVVSAVGAWVWLGQSMAPAQLFGASLVLLALAAITVNARVEAVRAATVAEPPE